MKCLLADITPALPDPNHFASIGWIVVGLFAICGGVYYVLQIVDRIRGREPHPPNEQLDQAQAAMNQRITKIEGEMQDLWNTMRAEDTATRNQLSKAIQDFEGSIGKLDGTLHSVNQTMQLLLERGLSRG